MASKPQSETGRSARWLVRFPRVVPLAIFALIAGVTALSVVAIERSDNRQELAQVEQTAIAIGTALDRRGKIATSYLRAGSALFSTVEAVPTDLFRRFASELQLADDLRGTDGLGWARSIAADELAAHEARTARELKIPYAVYPAPEASTQRLIPVTFLEPDTVRARRALGFDLFSEPMQRSAMEKAMQTAQPIASGRIALSQEGGGEIPGFVIFMPVFLDGASDGSGRRLKGFIYSPFNAQDLLTSVANPGIVEQRSVHLYDGDVTPANLLASHQAQNGIGQVSSTQIIVAGRQMTVEVRSAKGTALSPLSMITLLFGLAVASLSMLIARLLTQQAIEDQAALEYFAEQNSIRTSLTRELNHRVKNTLANVLSIVALTKRRAESLDQFSESLEGRIRALSATHDLLTQSEWGTTPIRQVIEAELAPYATADEAMLELQGPDVELAPNDALSFGLAVHELATNASKYGALSKEGAKVTITWERESDDLVRVEWVERGGPPVPQTRSRGFGTDLIEKIVAHELRNPVDLQFEEAGVRCTLHVPVRKPSEFALRAPR